MDEQKPLRLWQGKRSRLAPVFRRVLVIICSVATFHPFVLPPTVAGASGPVPPGRSPGTVQSMESKIRALTVPASSEAKSFEPIVMSEEEVNAYLKCHGPEFLPPGVRDPSVHITRERVFGSAMVDFSEAGRAGSSAADWGPKVLAAMFKGRQRVAAAGRVETQNGQAKVKVETVVVGTSAVPGWLVDFVLENYLQPRYKFDLSKPIALPDHVVRIELGSGRASFIRAPGK